MTSTSINAAPTTTDADLALNADLLTPIPNLSAAPHDAGFSTSTQPGTWTNADGVSVDLMVCPHQSGRTSPNARDARLATQGHPEPRTARIAAGLEPALVDHNALTLTSLDQNDDRSVLLNAAEPAAMLVAKLIKLQERLEARPDGRPDRTKPKDVTDIFRLLVGTRADDLHSGFIRHQGSPQAALTSRRAMEFVHDDLHRREGPALRAIFATEVGDDPIQVAQWDALIRELPVPDAS